MPCEMLYHVILASIPLFSSLSPDRLARLARASTVQDVAADAVVAIYGTPATRLVIVESGWLTAFRETTDGRRLRLGEYQAPCAVDKTAVLSGRGHSATWIARTRSRLRFLPATELFALIDDEPSVRGHVVRHLAGQLYDRQEDLLRSAYADTTARVAGWLADSGGRAGVRVTLPGGQEGLAETLGASRVSVNRSLGGLARAGILRVEPGAVVVLDAARLVERATS
jgi:CRP/FNR family transcriptional regulator